MRPTNEAWRRPNPVFSDEYTALRSVLIEARREAGLSQRELALELGKSPSHVARIESGQRRVDALELYHIARSVRLDPAQLFRSISEAIGALQAEEPAG